mmetsp:Transcript_26745/g.39560  ORF Transcript_26745/g.39560 Transcript_26745/m.39560 type:complete len:242 (+) Transcript_26745:42-767(+)|eukprot:CAMPEP_0194208910 /NCGR_PEP_ID=MMETSP0156-20130528/7219_1 /TAXON_ID=33649 /ORGANISM="Thalassionema nitzschioides, Strain L26-B" /LENGTH=241 /DNA_ID=CAMNT_0038935975 /DNA_START=31 /DNA_END=756 /DNA_ORIENTATION=+
MSLNIAHVIYFLLFLSFFGLGIAKQQEVDLGTTLVAVAFKGGVVVGADTRTSVGGYVSNRFADKIFPVSDNAVICRSGSAADTQYLASTLLEDFQSRFYRYGTRPSPRDVAYYLRSLVKEPMVASFICAGYQDGKGHIFSINPNGSIMEEDGGFAVSGSGSTFILGHMDNLYRSDMREDEAIAFVTNAVRLAIERDGSSGGFVRIHVITKDGSKIEVVYPPNNKISRPGLTKLKGFAFIDQ